MRLSELEKDQEKDLIWLAGFFDGDGCIHIGKYTILSRVNPTYDLQVILGQRNKWILNYIKEFIEDGFLLKHRSSGNWQLTLAANKALTFLNKICPYLKVKKLEAQIAIQFQQYKKDCSGKLIPPDELVWREMHYQLLKYIKRRR